MRNCVFKNTDHLDGSRKSFLSNSVFIDVNKLEIGVFLTS